MYDNPKISVIIPVYNVEPYLKDCLLSVQKQTFEDFEVILVNDGSKDNSGKICDDIAKADSRFKVIHKKNGGVNTARKIGIEQAKGKYITFLDGDDLFPGNALEVMYKKSEEFDLDICVGQQLIYRDGENVEDLKNAKYNLQDEYTKVFCAKDLDYFHMYEIEWFMVFGGKLTKRELFNNQYIAVNLKYGEDQVCIKETLFKANRISAVSDYVYYYRKRPNSATTRRNKRSIDIFESLDLLEKVLTDYNYIDKEYTHLINWALVSYLFHLRLFTPYFLWWEFISKICNYTKTIDMTKLKENEISPRFLKLIKRFNKNEHITFNKLYYIYKIFMNGGKI